MKIALLQFAPVIGQVEANIAQADALLSYSHAGDFDVLVLPEMAFSGYVFVGRSDVEALVDGCFEATQRWAERVAKALRCVVQVGSPRRVASALRNCVLVVRDNSATHFYDKHFLYETDERWAEPGEAFETIQLNIDNKQTTCALGICMDINPYRFEAAFEDFEFANFHKDSKADLILASMAWVLSKGDNMTTARDGSRRKVPASKPLNSTMNYWATRMLPIIKAKERRVIMAVCNRFGGENGTDFCGSSCVLEFKDGDVTLLGACGYQEDRLLVVDVDSLV
ncbi:Carbon-nitrogen hydrolase [Podochytrium sp. JEL0797]|nr:Carbon-nitrogen hydrolase [Podochytrium sp. JEL0797]